MALTYAESGALMTDLDFRARIKVACLDLATYIFNENPGEKVNHASRYRWAQGAGAAPDATAAQMQPMVCMDPAIVDQGSAISDDGLRAAVEGVVTKLF